MTAQPNATGATALAEALEKARRHLGAAAVAALVPLASLAVPGTAEAGVSIDRTSRVDGTVTPQGGGLNLYEFTVVNTTNTYGYGANCIGVPCIVDWELPFFSLNDLDVNSITSPLGWRHEIIQNPLSSSTFYYNNLEGGPYGQYSWNDYALADDPAFQDNPDAYGPNPQVFLDPPYIIHWYTVDCALDGSITGAEFEFCPGVLADPARGIDPGESLSGFSFVSTYASQAAPYLSSWFFQSPRSGDPPIPGDFGFGTPLSPERLAAQGIPEPGTMVLVAGGLLGLGWIRRRKATQGA